MEKSPQNTSQRCKEISFYVVAHADDWQLFMYSNIYRDILSPTTKVVFIVVTAGDAGMDEKFWRAREEGSISSLRFCLAPHEMLTETKYRTKFNLHEIFTWSVNNINSYFLRLPDGNLDGNGFQACQYQSLSKFKEGQAGALNAIDGSTTYYNWPDLINTFEAILQKECSEIPFKSIHYLNPDPCKNPGDHPDHRVIGQAIMAMQDIKCFHQLLYAGYSNCSAQEKLSMNNLFWKSGMLAAYEKAVYDLSGYSTLKENPGLYSAWCCSCENYISILPSMVT